MEYQSVLFVLLTLVSTVLGQNISTNVTNTTDDGSYPYDPVLAHRPNFARSLPIQILILGITLTLTAVLIIHLIFTAQYHWPLAPVNCILQMSAVTTLLISCIATLHVVLSSTVNQSMIWPYMLDYIAVELPPLTEENSDWVMGELVAWLLMNATVSGLIQITHIQFLTLLFPSGLERRLIYCLLGPLAIVSSTMHVLRISSDAQLVKGASAVQNICNATLTLLFTAALILWGCVINRRDAWRTDGGTAAFGAGAITLALISTALTFFYIPSRDQYVWMPGLMWAVILWQSFLGWWWWVGAGMGVGAIEELLRREEKRREKRRVKMAKRKVQKERAQTIWKGVTHVFSTGRQENQQQPQSDGGSSSDGTLSGSNGDNHGQRPRHSGDGATAGGESIHRATSRQTDASSRSGTTTTSGYVSRFLNQNRAGRYVYGWYLGLRHAHLTAAHEQAVERVERINQAYGPNARAGGRATFGWGLGSFGIRRQQRGRQSAPAEYELDEYESDEDHSRKPWHDQSSLPRMPQGDGEGEARARRRVARTADLEPRAAAEAGSHRPSSLWWWGPLQRWRLQDATDYRS